MPFPDADYGVCKAALSFFDKDVPDRTIEDLVKQSYDLVAASLPKKERAALQTP